MQKLTYPAQRALLRATRRPDKTVSGPGQALMELAAAGLTERGTLTDTGEAHADALLTQEHGTDPIDARFASLAPGHPARTAAAA